MYDDSAERVEVKSVYVGEFVADPDEWGAQTDEAPDAGEVDWKVVCDESRTGDGREASLLLQNYDGSRYWTPMLDGATFVWRLWRDGEPVEDKDVFRAWKYR